MAANLFFPESHRQMLNIIAYSYEFLFFLDLQKKTCIFAYTTLFVECRINLLQLILFAATNQLME
ncbi:hypothetical protein AsAng_0025410 [Aureispira anguillae]|uniref:Uncharacterized protein n=1 Tax=Aureispira anguillae TaxID=2864201 RepID=A0A915YF04_9BACT|nr:hypothetical protein AsAng_0025410 [Aureispira anguillae]